MHEQIGQQASAFVAVVGRPSVGKSTLLNTICGHKISIVSPVPQTTRNRVRGIYTDERGQLVFVDTPGFHDSERKFNNHMTSLIRQTVEDSDLILRVVDLTRASGAEEETLSSLLESAADRTVVALNKADLVTESSLAETPENTIRVSATKGDGIDALLAALFAMAPEGPHMYPDEFYTDQEPTFRVSEIIREQAMLRTREELPHALYVETTDLEEQNKGSVLVANATIYVERESQKGILVGKGGGMIRLIREHAEHELGDIFERKVRVHLKVKVHPKWRTRSEVIKKVVT
ncbi:MAG: GTPase Era [Spirochaetaceae bacterium]|nr:MAG: GTPase Era [Spirochaetaceae bacterium]